MTELAIDRDGHVPSRNKALNPIAEALAVGGYTIVKPRKAFAILRERPYWVVIFALLSLATAFLGAQMKPFNIQAALTALPNDMPAEQQQELVAKWDRAQRTGLMLSPALLLVKLAFSALVMWLLAIAAGKTEKFTRVLSLVTYTSIIVVAEAWFVFATIAWKGMDAIRTPFDLQPSIGLNALIHTNSVPLNAFLGGLNPFELWYVAVLAIGLAVVLELRKVWAATISFVYWAFTLALQVGIAAIAVLIAKGQ